MSFVLAVATNLVANVAFWLLLGLGFLVGGRTVERRIVKFFGLGNGRRIQVYLSNVAGPRADGRPRMTLAFHEFQATQSINKLFGAAPLRLPELARGLVDGIWLRRPIRYLVDVSPHTTIGTQLSDSCIVVGSGARNSIRRYSLENRLVKATLVGELGSTQPAYAPDEEVNVSIRLDGDDVQHIKARKNVAIIERVNRIGEDAVNFFCVGVRGDSSWAAVEYLVRNWKHLVAEFGDGDFVIVLGFPWGTDYLNDYPEPARVATVRG
ncbi:hypothetical protein OG874_25995 [Nocardia sp. NBC_00565]|uniref:hypothetical protein n=1 Tax=Nocardia sp. NBC_00565 TaxID=2975993 RepID=UPI002E8203C3|nr:hypothetical protein [Nocardia sp. NBC_00565]WUC00343.1 hypothetical protein OG874_25995 [Nocardia sp. NBC_00565]